LLHNFDVMRNFSLRLALVVTCQATPSPIFPDNGTAVVSVQSFRPRYFLIDNGTVASVQFLSDLNILIDYRMPLYRSSESFRNRYFLVVVLATIFTSARCGTQKASRSEQTVAIVQPVACFKVIAVDAHLPCNHPPR
jgi:hypothetical protein